MKILYYAALGTLLALTACKKNDYTKTEAIVLKEWTVNVSSENENHLTARVTTPATGTYTMKLYSDSSIAFDVYIQDYQDKIVGATLQAGNPIDENGPVVVNLTPRVSGGYVSGQIAKIGATAFNNLMNNVPMYINVISANNPTGLVRGQLDKKIMYSQRVALSGYNAVPQVITPTQGTAYLRLTEDKVFYSKVDVYEADPGDPINAAAIYKGAVGTNGTFFFPLQLNIPKTVTLNETDYSTLLNSRLFVLGTSNMYPDAAGGKIRGQIR